MNRKSNSIKKWLGLLTTLFLICVNTYNAFAQGYVQQKLKVLFVIDCSGSMTTNDSEKLIPEFIKMYIDTVDANNTQVGFLTFNDSITGSYPITAIANDNLRNELKTKLDTITRKGSTDIGLALNNATQMFVDKKEDTRNIIVFISDGETDLSASSVRTYADSLKDEASAYEAAAGNNIAIYTIGISKNGTLDTGYLFNIAQKTNGKTYEITGTQDVHTTFNSLFNQTTGVPLKTEAVVKNTHQSLVQTMTVPIDKIRQSVTLLQYQTPLKAISANAQSKLTAANIYATATVAQPTVDKLDISYDMGANNDVKFLSVAYSDIEPRIEVTAGQESKESEISVRFYDKKTNTVITDSKFYQGLNAQLTVYNSVNSELSKLVMNSTGTAFVATYQNKVPAKCSSRVTITGEEYSYTSTAQTLEFTNTAPTQTAHEKLTTLKSKKQRKVDLNTFFSDPNGDLMQYEVLGNNTAINTLMVSNNELLINSIGIGDDILRIKATDERGLSTEGVFLITAEPFLVYYSKPIITISTIAIILLTLITLLEYRKRRVIEKESRIVKTSEKFFNIRFEGYFLNTASGNEIPALYFNPSYIDGKPVVSLGDLLSIMDVKEKLPEAKKIYFKAGKNDTVIFYHYTNCDVTLGNRIVSKGNEAVLQYDDRLYITFEDEVTEVEIRCKRLVRSKV